ncbi:hypothetical protein D3C84_532180 [compost metagenome]
MPDHGIEVPHAILDGRQVPAEPRRQQVHGQRHGHHRPRFAHQHRQRQRQAGQQHDVQREGVHEVRLEAQQQFIDQGLLRVGDEVVHAHFLHQIPRFHMAVGEEHDAHQHRQQENMHHVEHPGAAQNLHAGNQITVPSEDFPVGQDRRVTGEKHENFRGIAETEVTRGDLTEGVVRHVIPEDEDQRQASKKVDSVIAFKRHDSGLVNGC